MHRDGVRLLAGTNAAGPRLVGFSLHKELAEMVKIGMTPAEALQTTTLNPAVVLGQTADVGTVGAGKLADLVILGRNPLESIENTEQIFAVVLGGWSYQRHDLDRLLAGAERPAIQN
jgi:imidazolonepropionase-like amidohydrolase